MTVTLAFEYRFARLPDGSVWTQNQYAYGFWRRYMNVFDHVRCIARVQEVAGLDGEWHRADGPGVTFAAVPHYLGPLQLVARWAETRRAFARIVTPGGAYILRPPGMISDFAHDRLDAQGYPFGIEVLGDPFDVFAPGAVAHPLRRYFRWRATRRLRRQCRAACAASYVTETALQRRYPPSGPSIAASSIELDDERLVSTPRRYERPASRLVFVGSLEHYLKAPDLVIRAVGANLARGLDLQLTIVGDGRFRGELEAVAAAAGCLERVRFIGALPAARVPGELDHAEVFVLPSRSEGLPRAMVEAMARGLPCIGSDAGGIPELLAPDALVAAGDQHALTERLRDVVSDPARLCRMSAENLERARAYRSSVLQHRRDQFYRDVRTATEAWLHGHPQRASVTPVAYPVPHPSSNER